MGFFNREEEKFSRAARTSTIGAIVLATATGLIFGLSFPYVARADDPPPSTVPTPTLPTPDPAPPKRPPTPAPPSHQVPHSPTYQAPVAPVPLGGPAAAVKPNVRAHTKPKPKDVRHKRAQVQRHTTLVPRVTFESPFGAVSVRHAFQTKPGDSFDLESLLIVLGLGFAIACFTIALVPATHVKWRPAAIFVSERQLDLTVVGLASLVTAGFTFLWTHAP